MRFSREKLPDGPEAEAGASRFLVIDDNETFVTSVGRSLQTLGHVVWTAETFPQALAALDICRATYVISELRVNGRWIFDFISGLSERTPLSRLVVATAYPSIATAVKLTRMGAAGYFAKPVSIPALLSELGDGVEPVGLECDSDEGWPSLDRAIWEYLNQAYVAAGSMSAAARRLKLDRRSLRRMLAKYPPMR
jgi:two-component system response regulator RegA